MTLIERVARCLCLAAAGAEERKQCPHCRDEEDCSMHYTFASEAHAAIREVRKSDRGK